ncbi:MAG: hypothetical protein HZB43_13760 [candidate division Zixibacteria bacterium]|nr:hypothetical protein [candidate division Zixibacteria bacterium]
MTGRLRAALEVFGPRWWLTAFLIATLWVWQRYTVVQLGHRIDRLQTHITEMDRVRVALLAENSRLSSRSRIEEIAINHLGMIPTPESRRVRFACAPRPGIPGHPADELPSLRNGQSGSLRLTQAGTDQRNY